MPIQKIFIERGDTPANVVEKILKSPAEQITLVIPREAAVSASADNFSLLKREAEAAGKEVGIESVDESAIILARKGGLHAVHPLFAAGGARMLTDIVPTSIRERIARPAGGEAKAAAKSLGKRSVKSVKVLSVPPESELENIPELRAVETTTTAGSATEATLTSITVTDFVSDEESRRLRRRRRKKITIVIATVAIVVVGVWGVGAVFGKTRITLEFNKVPWEYSGQISVRTSNAAVDAENKSLPGEAFNDHRNLTNIFSATGRMSTASRARGKITVYNAFSTASQQLVANTRFAAPDGKIFRLVSAVSVPGAKSQSSKIVPSSVEADIIADQGGEAYNVGPIEKLTIPGFQGTPKYDGFYGAITAALTGGSDTETPVTTDKDISSGKQRTEELLKNALLTGVLRNQPNDFLIIDGASRVGITKLAVVSSTDEAGKFGVFGEGEINAIAFRSADMNTLLAELASASSSDGMALKDVTIKYANQIVDFAKGTLTVTITAKGTLTGEADSEEVKQMLAGKKVSDARSLVLGIANLSHAKISMWPAWLSAIPANPSRITIQSD